MVDIILVALTKEVGSKISVTNTETKHFMDIRSIISMMIFS